MVGQVWFRVALRAPSLRKDRPPASHYRLGGRQWRRRRDERVLKGGQGIVLLHESVTGGTASQADLGHERGVRKGG